MELLERYRISTSLNSELYYTNCFLYAFSQYGVSIDKIDVIRSYLVNIYIKIKDIGYIGKLLKLLFIIYLTRDHIKYEYMSCIKTHYSHWVNINFDLLKNQWNTFDIEWWIKREVWWRWIRIIYIKVSLLLMELYDDTSFLKVTES